MNSIVRSDRTLNLAHWLDQARVYQIWGTVVDYS